MSVRDLPKVELHLHLDCSLSYDVVRRLDPTITEEAYRDEFIAPPRCRDLTDFLTRAVKGFSLMQDEQALTLVTQDLFAQLARDNVVYAEIRFAPLLHLAGGLTPERVVETVNAATAHASAETGIQARLLLCTLRHYSTEQSMETVRLVERFQGTHVAGFDIAGDEAGFPIDAHIPAFRHAQERGIPRTAHAGEARGPESVWETLREFHPSRIGHGVRSIEDPALLEHEKQQGIHLEVCPTSNVQTNIVDTLADHPLPQLYGRGLSVNVNTDTRTITNVTLAGEYERLHQAFGWDEEEFLRCNLNAVAAAFIPEEVRWPLRERLLAA